MRSWGPETSFYPFLSDIFLVRTREIKMKAYVCLWAAQKRKMNNSYTAESWSEGMGIFKCLLFREKLESALFIWTFYFIYFIDMNHHVSATKNPKGVFITDGIERWGSLPGALTYRDLLTWGRSWFLTPRVGCSHLMPAQFIWHLPAHHWATTGCKPWTLQLMKWCA